MAYNGSHVAREKANREHRVDVDFARLIQMCRFDCEDTLHKFCGQINHHKFDVPMGGHDIVSPGLAILCSVCCAVVELDMELGPEGLIGSAVRFMDDVFDIYAAGSNAEEQVGMDHYGRMGVGYPPPLVLNVEQPANLHHFLELQLNSRRKALQCQLLNPV